MKHGQQTEADCLLVRRNTRLSSMFRPVQVRPCDNAMKPGLALALYYGRQNLVSGKLVMVVWSAVLYNKKQFVSKQPKALAKKNKPTVAGTH
eukprot:3979397-Pleurochrysis_carterae.AAC.1